MARPKKNINPNSPEELAAAKKNIKEYNERLKGVYNTFGKKSAVGNYVRLALRNYPVKLTGPGYISYSDTNLTTPNIQWVTDKMDDYVVTADDITQYVNSKMSVVNQKRDAKGLSQLNYDVVREAQGIFYMQTLRNNKNSFRDSYDTYNTVDELFDPLDPLTAPPNNADRGVKWRHTHLSNMKAQIENMLAELKEGGNTNRYSLFYELGVLMNSYSAQLHDYLSLV